MIDVRFHAHACLSFESEGQILLTDPWFDGEVFNRSWALLAKPDLAHIDFDRVRWVWISHEHPDHFHLPSLRTIRERTRGPLTLLYRKQANPNVKRAAIDLGYRVIELEAGVTTPLWGGVSVTSYPSGTDTMLVTECGGRVILNQNDCLPDAATTQAIRTRFPHIDAWFFYFSIAGFHGNPEERERLAAARAARLSHLSYYYDALHPRTFVPFASFIRFCREANSYVNEWAVTLDHVARHCANLPVQFLADGDVLRWEGWESRNAENLERWREAWSSAHVARPSRPVEDNELARAGNALMREVEVYPARLRDKAPGECQVLLRDSGRGALIDFRNACFRLLNRPSEATLVAELDAEDLLFLLRFPWGADTLFVSSCFAVRDAQRWFQLISFCHSMYTTPMASADRIERFVRRIERTLLRGRLMRWLRQRAPTRSSIDPAKATSDEQRIKRR